VPINVAATAPLIESVRVLRAPIATSNEMPAPISARSSTSVSVMASYDLWQSEYLFAS